MGLNARRKDHSLDRVLLKWNDLGDVFRKRDLLQHICAQGASGSGKTSGVGYQIGKALVRDEGISGLILASKPGEDRNFWQSVFAESGRPNALIIVAPDQAHRFNWLQWETKNGADSREIANLIMTASETQKRGEGGGKAQDPFFPMATERMMHLGVEPLRLATGYVDAAELQRFVNGMALSPEQLRMPEWRQGFHCKTLEAAYQVATSDIEKTDMDQCLEAWLNEYPNLNDRTRSSITTQVNQTLTPFTSGIVRTMLSGKTNISPAALEGGQWILVDMPVSRWGASGQFVNAAWKLAVQRHVLRRVATPESRIIVTWIDEFQNHLNSFDSKYLAEARSHLGACVVLTQSLHSYYAALNGGPAAEHLANAMLSNFGTRIFTALGDSKSAQWASEFCGRSKQILISGSMAPQQEMWDELMGRTSYTGSFSEHMESNVEPVEFMHGLRTGGPPSYMVDAWVIRSGQPFSTGQNWLRTAFSQR
jgi:Type IV secretion-system coupling protein DNA-binding domain